MKNTALEVERQNQLMLRAFNAKCGTKILFSVISGHAHASMDLILDAVRIE